MKRIQYTDQHRVICLQWELPSWWDQCSKIAVNDEPTNELARPRSRQSRSADRLVDTVTLTCVLAMQMGSLSKPKRV